MLQTVKAYGKHLVKRALGRPSVPPPVRGVADANWYDAAYTAIDAYHAPYWESHYYFLWCVIADRLRRERLRRIVDIGCGPGQFASCLFDMAEIEQYTGLDFSPKAVELARQFCPRGTFVVGDATTTDLAAKTPHDAIVCMEVLEHVPTDADVLRQFTTGSRCLCTVPNFDYPSHVRYFKTVDDVRDRYAKFFDRFDVWALKSYFAPKSVFYLIDGIRNTHR
jgi:SAM-dependent methyltransferase